MRNTGELLQYNIKWKKIQTFVLEQWVPRYKFSLTVLIFVFFFNYIYVCGCLGPQLWHASFHSHSMRTLSCGMWSLSFPTRDRTWVPATPRWFLASGPSGKSRYLFLMNVCWLSVHELFSKSVNHGCMITIKSSLDISGYNLSGNKNKLIKINFKKLSSYFLPFLHFGSVLP